MIVTIPPLALARLARRFPVMQLLKDGTVKLSKADRRKLTHVIEVTDPSLDFLTDDVVDAFSCSYDVAYKIIARFS